MKKSLIPVTVVGAAVCFALRRLQLAHVTQLGGVLPRGDGASVALYLSAAAIALTALVCCLLTPKREPMAPANKTKVRGLLVVVAGLALLGSYLPPSLDGTFLHTLTPILALAAACAIAIEGLFQMQGQSASLLGGCVLPVFLGVLVISDYRSWSYDPQVADFCFKLLFLVSAMLASYHLAAFRVGRGKRRLTAFFTVCALCFAGAVLAEGDIRLSVRTGALCLYLGSELWPYLRTPGQVEQIEQIEQIEQPQLPEQE